MAKNTAPAETTKVLTCKCKHVYQDATYGPGKRLHNRAGAKKETAWRCTVCGDLKKQVVVIQTAPADGKEDEKKAKK